MWSCPRLRRWYCPRRAPPVAETPGDLAECTAVERAARRGDDQVHEPLFVGQAGAILPVVGDLEGADRRSPGRGRGHRIGGGDQIRDRHGHDIGGGLALIVDRHGQGHAVASVGSSFPSSRPAAASRLAGAGRS